MQSQTHSIGVIGGTGPPGKGLGHRFARAGHRVFLGSRSPERAQVAARELNARLPADRAVTGTSNATAARVNDVVLLAVPWNGHAEVVASLSDHLAGKIVVSCVNPLGLDKRGPFDPFVSDGSAAEQAAALLPESLTVGTFHHVSAVSLLGDAECLDDEDVLVCGDDAAAKGVVQQIARAVTGKPGVDAGALRLARQLEPLTAVLISINKRYKTHSGLAVTGLTASR